jgi:parallel beta-helix repeat protein
MNSLKSLINNFVNSSDNPLPDNPLSDHQAVTPPIVRSTNSGLNRHQGNKSWFCLGRRWQSMGLGLALLLGTGVQSLDMVLQQPALAIPTIAQNPEVPANATIVYVNPVLGTDSPSSGSAGTPFRTITYTLQLAQPNTVIQLAPGSYTRDTGEVFPLTIPEGEILLGDRANRGQTVAIIGGGEYISPTYARQNVTLRPLNNSRVEGVLVTNPNSRGTGLWVESTNPLIRDNTFTNSLRDGVFVTGTGNPVIEGNIFLNNDANGVSIARNAQGTIRANLFQETGFGLAIGDNSSPTVINNRIIQNVDGVVVSNSARPILRNNEITGNERDGLVAITNAQPDLGTGANPGGNTIQNNGRYDLHNATNNITISAVGNAVDPTRVEGEFAFVPVDAPPSLFPDVPGHWAQAYIEALAAMDVIGGFPDGTYRPNDPVTRAQFAAILNKAFNPAPKRTGINFTDVERTFWGRTAIEAVYRGGFLSGYPGGTFRPNQRIPRMQVLVALVSGLELNGGDMSVLGRYQDALQIPEWASGAIATATVNSIVVNYPNVAMLEPNREATRAEVAAFVYQALVQAGQAEPLPSPYLVTP